MAGGQKHRLQGDPVIDKAQIKLLNLSFPRCGTSSIQFAFDILGYNCWHSRINFGKPEMCRRWMAALDAKYLSKGPLFTRNDWDAIFHPFTTISADPPATAFAEELIAVYPDAKVILVERDEDSWYQSFNEVLIETLSRWDVHFSAMMDPEYFGPIHRMHRHWIHVWWRCSTADEMRTKAIQMYREHNEMVRKLTPPDRLHVLHLEDIGWEPLCNILETDIPDEPFPKANDRQRLNARITALRNRGLWLAGRMALRISVPVFVCTVAWWLLRK